MPDSTVPVGSRVVPSSHASSLNAATSIFSDPRDENGGSHEYLIHVTPAGQSEPSAVATIQFQHGPILEAGLNGVSDEALIAVVIDRLQGFQEGPTPGGRGKFSSRYNALAITKLEEAQMWLEKRTTDRQARSVEGTHQV